MLLTLYYYFIIFFPIILEGFPVSSSGHVLLYTCILSYFNCVPSTNLFPKNLDHILHGPIACMLVYFFYKRFSFFLLHIYRRRCLYIIIQLIFFMGITTSITAVGYIFFCSITVDKFPLYWGYMLTSISLFSLNICPFSNKTVASYTKTCILGLAQVISLLPGVSRFGFTFVTARWLGFSLHRSFELSFLMEIPISCAGFAKGLWSQDSIFDISSLLQLKFLCTMIIASCLGLCGFYIVRNIILHNQLWLFGYYTTFLTIVSWIIK